MILNFYNSAENIYQSDIAMIANYKVDENGDVKIRLIADGSYTKGETEETLIRKFVGKCQDVISSESVLSNVIYCEPDAFQQEGEQTTALADQYFVGIEVSENDQPKIVTNIENSKDLLGACGFLLINYQGEIKDTLKTEILSFQNKLLLKRKSKQTIENQSQIKQLFNSNDITISSFFEGILCLTCSSENEYDIMKKKLAELGCIVTKRVVKEGWNDVCKYVYVDYKSSIATGSAVITSSHKLPDCCDGIVQFSKLFTK